MLDSIELAISQSRPPRRSNASSAAESASDANCDAAHECHARQPPDGLEFGVEECRQRERRDQQRARQSMQRCRATRRRPNVQQRRHTAQRQAAIDLHVDEREPRRARHYDINRRPKRQLFARRERYFYMSRNEITRGKIAMLTTRSRTKPRAASNAANGVANGVDGYKTIFFSFS